MERFISKHHSAEFDLIIIGGGITGATLVYEAGLRGLKVALFEKGDYGSATSSATSKLIHGGLRYLKNLELGLVRESLRERKIMSNIAPNFVYPIPFMIPSFQSLKSNKWSMQIGMWLYDLLSYDKAHTWDESKKLPRFKALTTKTTLKLEPCVKKAGLTGSTVYYDCQNIFPERLTLAFLKSAEKQGAKLSNYAKVTAIVRNDNQVTGVKVTDEISGKESHFKATTIVNCAGPWADLLINNATSTETKHHIRRSEGIHIVTKKLCNTHAVSVMTKNGRHIMVMPWRNHTLIGTTDREYVGNPDDYKVSKQSILGLLNDVNENYDVPPLKYKDVKFYYGGLRPLADTDTENVYESSRKYEIYDNADEGLEGLFTVEGGKYTTSRQLAIEVVDKIAKKKKLTLPKSGSETRYLCGSNIVNMKDFLHELQAQYPDFSAKTVEYLGKNYGMECHAVFRLALENPEWDAVLNAEGEILAEVAFAVQNESALTLEDVLFRRTGLGGIGHPGEEALKKVASLMSDLLKWNKARYEKELEIAINRFQLPV
jgi:glycerol-3-phosphate dehydrogenase